MLHSTIKIRPHLYQQEKKKEGKKTLAQIWEGSHQVRVKLLGKTSALSFLVLKCFPVPVFTFTSHGIGAFKQGCLSGPGLTPQDLSAIPCTAQKPLCTGQEDLSSHTFP